MPSLTLVTPPGTTHVHLDPGGDHIVTEHRPDPRGGTFDTMLGAETAEFERTVARAKIGSVFVVSDVDA